MEYFNRLNIKIIEFKTASNEIRRFGVYGKIELPLLAIKELSVQFIGVHRVIEPLLEESIALGIKPNYEREYESLIDFSIKFLNRTLDSSIKDLQFNKKGVMFYLDKERLNEIKVLSFTDDDLKKWDILIKK